MKIPYFCCIGAELKRYSQDFDFMNQVYLYKVPTDDSIEEVLAQDYFKAVADTVLQDDIVYIYEPTAQVLHTCRFNKQAGHITAVQLANNVPGLTPNRVLISDATGHITAGDVTLEYLKNKVNLDGTSTMTGPLKFRAGSFSGAIAGGLGDGVSIYKIKTDGTIDSEVASLTKTNGFTPGTTNAQNIGSPTLKWKDAHVARVITSIINNGYDLFVPAKSGTLATMSDVELAARSGRMLTDQGKWYAKMYSATTVPTGAEYDGRNYADFSQVDQDNNPIIVIYEGQNGAWVQSEIITPPAEYDGYVPITSKIWDIVEQAGQQGGRVLWNHTSKEFTPEPRIISTNDIEITGDSTVIMPDNPSGNQIVNKNYVDEAIAAIPTPTVDIVQSIDAEIVGTLTINGAIVSGFSSSNYLSIPASFHLSGADISSFEIRCSFTTQDPIGTSYYHMLRGRVNLMIDPTYHQLRVEITDGTNTQTFFGTTNLAGDTKYYEKLEYDGTNYKLWLSTDGSTYNLEQTVAATVFATDYSNYKICRDTGAVASIDMSDWFVKTNGLIIWSGMDSPGLHQRVVKGHEVIAFQAPTAGNNYTWYRKYADGWVEQGGHTTSQNVTFPITMADTNYHVLLTSTATQSNNNVRIVGFRDATTTSMVLQCNVVNQSSQTSAANDGAKYWEVKGMYAQ